MMILTLPPAKTFLKRMTYWIIFSFVFLFPTRGVGAKSIASYTELSGVRYAKTVRQNSPAHLRDIENRNGVAWNELAVSYLVEGPLNYYEHGLQKQPELKEKGNELDLLESNGYFSDLIEAKDFNHALQELSSTMGEPKSVMVRHLSREDIQSLLNLDREVGIAVLYGRIVLFTSGDGEEVNLLRYGTQLLNEVDFLAHTHPGSLGGPTDLDWDAAAELSEYVIQTEGKVLEYNKSEIIRDDLTFLDILEKIDEAVTVFPPSPDGHIQAAVTHLMYPVTWGHRVPMDKKRLDRSGIRLDGFYDELFERTRQDGLILQVGDMAAQYGELWTDMTEASYEYGDHIWWDFAIRAGALDDRYQSWADRNHSDVHFYMNSQVSFRRMLSEVFYYRISINGKLYD